jgi:hypothetical protein
LHRQETVCIPTGLSWISPIIHTMVQSFNRRDQGIVDWLISSEDPTVRLAALRQLDEHSEDDPLVQGAIRDAMRTGPIPKILSKQEPGGYWGNAEDFYINSKYKGTVWNVILLAQLGADGNDVRVRSAAEFLLRWSQHESGGFGYRGSADGGTAEGLLPCLNGNLVWSMVRFGMKDDDRVRRSIEWITKYQRFDDNEGPAPKGWPYSRESCWGKHTCHMGAIKDLKAISAIPGDERSEEMDRVVSKGAEYLLNHRLYKRSHDPTVIAKTRWTQFGFPLFWDTDALEMLEVLADLGYHDERMDDAIELVLSKRRPDGKWRNERSYAGRVITTIERQGAPSQWVTLKAMVTLRKLDRLDDR